MSALTRWATREGDLHVVSLVRVLIGALLGLSALRAAHELFTGPHFADVFHLPLVPEALVPSRPVYTALVIGQLAMAALVIAGVWARAALLGSATTGLYVLLCDRLGYHNNRYALLLFALLLSFTPCDRFFVVTRRESARERRGPLWAQTLAQLQLSIIYLASGGAKLLDDDWRGGIVLADRLHKGASMAHAAGVPLGLAEFLSEPIVASALAKMAIATELFLAVALHLPRWRAFALWWGLMFHLTIEITSKVELFGWLVLSVYALFATSEVRERVVTFDPGVKRQRLSAWVIFRLDWLCRFQHRRQAGVAALTVTSRDGSDATGFAAWARVTRAVPALFALSIPMAVLARIVPRRAAPPATPLGARSSAGSTTNGASRANAGDP